MVLVQGSSKKKILVEERSEELRVCVCVCAEREVEVGSTTRLFFVRNMCPFVVVLSALSVRMHCAILHLP